MKRLLLSLALLAACALSAHAQLRLGLTAERSSYLLYEPVPLHLTLQNDAGFDLVFQDAGEHPWLSFLVTRADRSVVSADRHIPGRELKLPEGGSVSLDVDLTPLYAMRETGSYKVRAVVDVGGREYLSAPIEVTLSAGRRIWSETRTVDGSPRIFSLLRFAPTMQGTFLYLRAEEPAQNLVYSTARLGEIVDLGKPQTAFDAEGRLHVLFLTGNAVYRYVRAGQDGAPLSQKLYDSLPENPPRLQAAADGSVLVAGGRLQTEGTRRERLSEVQGRVKSAQPTFEPLSPSLTPSAPRGGPQSPLPDSAN
ncbi:MAG: hypothetical protein PW734_04055 [Verrucomicrobium sp.]|nr:hypothetical protein [Verrucomicrobium sp.]